VVSDIVEREKGGREEVLQLSDKKRDGGREEERRKGAVRKVL